MAKKVKEEVEGLSVDELTRHLENEVEKDYGKGVMVSGEELLASPPMRISISPAMDVITSGGIEEGSWIGITGLPKTSKTTMALCLAANCQRPEYGSRRVLYLKIEGRLSTTHLRGISGLNRASGKFDVIQSVEGKILSSEDFLSIGSKFLKNTPGGVLIIDSVSALCPESELNSELGDEAIASGYKLYAKFVRTHAQVVPVNRNIVIVITHMASQIGWGKSGYAEKSPQAQKYQYDTMLRTLFKEDWGTDKKIGLKVKWTCNTSRLGPPGMQIESYLRYGVGVDRLYELIMLAEGANILTGKGWYSLSYLKKPQYAHLYEGEVPKAQGFEKLYLMLLKNEPWAKALEAEVMTAYGAGRGPE